MFTAFLRFLALSTVFFPLLTIAGWNFRSENYFYSKLYSLDTYDLDPSNRNLGRPDAQLSADVRPELKATYQSSQKWILRPRWTYSHELISYKDTQTQFYRGQGKIDLTDAYWESIWNDYVRTTVGLQVYQWGPAEFLNASNPLFHLNNQQRSTIFKEKGQVLIRVNVDYSRNWNQVFIYEPISNAEPSWIEGDTFVPKGLIKTEWISTSGVNSVGFVFGKEEKSMNFFGEYFIYSPYDGLSFYLDSKHTENSVAYYPDNNAYGTESLLYNTDLRGGWVSFGVAGIRKEWSHLDLRLEYIYNTGGWTSEQFTDAKKTLLYPTPDILKNAERLARPGLELMGRSYAYISARFFSLGKKQKHNIGLRYLISETDSSSTLITTYDYDLNDSINLYAELFGSFGPKEGELNLIQQKSLMAGFKWSL